jgi:hypothetical protein
MGAVMLRSLVAAAVALVAVSACVPIEAQPGSDRAATVRAIGDSIMVGAEAYLADLVPTMEIDAQSGRPFSAGIDVLAARSATGDVPDVLVFALGTNGGASPSQIDAVMDLASDVDEVIFVNVRVPRDWETATNAAIADAVGRYPNATLVDWNRESAGQNRLFRSDGYHPNSTGSELWANLIVIEIKN